MFEVLSNKIASSGSWLNKLKSCFIKTGNYFDKLKLLLQGKNYVDVIVWQEIEKILLEADLGIDFTKTLLKELQTKKELNTDDLYVTIKKILTEVLLAVEKPLIIEHQDKPYLILVIGVNGSGKTTTIAKLGHYFKQQYRVMFAAGDTFRAAAIEQLELWATNLDLPLIKQHHGADSAAVIFDALQAAYARKVEVLIADTSGRLHTQQNLLVELAKIVKVIRKLDANAPQEILLVLDATIGQNSLQQAKVFLEVIGVTGLIITKLDGTAKGGAIFNIANTLKLPIRFIGIGEQAQDLKVFNAQEFVAALFD